MLYRYRFFFYLFASHSFDSMVLLCLGFGWGAQGTHTGQAGQGPLFIKIFVWTHKSIKQKATDTTEEEEEEEMVLAPNLYWSLVGIVFILSGQIQKNCIQTVLTRCLFLISWPRTFRCWIFSIEDQATWVRETAPFIFSLVCPVKGEKTLQPKSQSILDSFQRCTYSQYHDIWMVVGLSFDSKNVHT